MATPCIQAAAGQIWLRSEAWEGGLILKAPLMQRKFGEGLHLEGTRQRNVRLSCSKIRTSSLEKRFTAGIRGGRTRVVQEGASEATTFSAPSVEATVDRLLELVAETDRGAEAEEARRKEVEQLIGQLENRGLDEPLKSPLVFGEWDVAYTSSPTAAGGYYRSLLGRYILKTEELVQTISEPNNAGNRLVFRAFNVIPGEVTLQGKFEALDSKWVKVVFEKPTFQLGPFSFRYGGISTVQLSVTFLDDRVRIGRGSRGSLFVFKRR